ncbi:MAG: hypothetical protein J6X80_07820 [Lachnospiraceae bacterium]|nr:hypothetical protein [Lachnospiraceae bacterium]
MLRVGKNVEITNYERIVLSETAMRGKSEYEVVNKGDKAEITFYQYRYSQKEEIKTPEKCAECENDEVLKILNECRISKWDGFHGKHPRNVKDGIMFSFEAAVNEGLKIHADGSENFPKNYSTLTNWFRDKLFRS